MHCVILESALPVSDVLSGPASPLQNVEPARNTSFSTPASLIPVSAQSTSRNTASTTPEDLMPFPNAGPRKGWLKCGYFDTSILIMLNLTNCKWMYKNCHLYLNIVLQWVGLYKLLRYCHCAMCTFRISTACIGCMF